MAEAEYYPNQQQPPMMAQQGYNPANFSQDVLRYQLDTEEFLEEMECRFLAKKKVYDNKTNMVVIVDDKNSVPLINKIGWSRLRAHIRTSVDKLFALTDLEENDIRMFTIHAGRNIINQFYLHWDEYNIKSVADASTMVQIITNSIYANLRRSYLKNYLDYLTTTHYQTEHVSINQGANQNQGMYGEPQKRGILSRIFGR